MFKHLETFFAVFEGRSFTKAAEKLFISQPTVSVHIRQLENELHMKLFERNGRSEIIPTANGERLYHRLLDMQTEWRKVIFDISQQQSEKSVLRIVATEIASVTFLPSILNVIKQSLPALAYKINILSNEEINNSIGSNNIDLILSDKKIINSNFRCTSTFKDELVLSGKSSVETWLLPNPNHPDYDFFQSYFRANELFINNSIVINDDFTRTHLVEHGLGKTIMSKNVAPSSVPFENLDTTYARQMYLAHPVRMYDPIITGAIETIKAVYKETVLVD